MAEANPLWSAPKIDGEQGAVSSRKVLRGLDTYGR
jgi:hypothetical protein